MLRRTARILLATCLCASACTAPEPTAALRVGASGDYAPFSVRDPASGALSGFDAEIARRYAADQALRIEWVPFRWPDLLEDLEAGRFDVAMSGVTVRPERSLAGRYTLAVANSGALALVIDSVRWSSNDALDAPDARIAVNAGGHLERAARARFGRARIEAVPDNAAVVTRLLSGRADAAVTDTLEAPHWLERAPGAAALRPFTRDRKAYLVRADRPALARALDAWLLAREADGSLAALRAHHLGPADEATAAPSTALLAAIDERLALMPLVAEAKRRAGRAIVDREREVRVLDAAAEAVRAAALEAHVEAPGDDAVRALFRAQIDAAVAIQKRVLAAEPDEALPAVDLAAELRPALLRIGERIAGLVVRLPDDLERQSLRSQARLELARHALEPERIDAIADAIARCTR